MNLFYEVYYKTLILISIQFCLFCVYPFLSCHGSGSFDLTFCVCLFVIFFFLCVCCNDLTFYTLVLPCHWVYWSCEIKWKIFFIFSGKLRLWCVKAFRLQRQSKRQTGGQLIVSAQYAQHIHFLFHDWFSWWVYQIIWIVAKLCHKLSLHYSNVSSVWVFMD